MKNSFVAAASIGVLLTACGGGGDGGTPALTDAQRAAAATITAQSSSNACGPIRPFYWEIGDRSAALATGSVNGASGTAVYTAATPMSIASASKWLYSSYVVQKQNAALSDSDIKFLTFRSGYTNFTSCLPGQTVDSCVNYLDNGVHSDATDGRFDYGGHMQKHASVIGLGALDSASLAVELRSQLGSDVGLAYSQPQPAGGVVSTAADYARFLRKLLGADLKMATMLGSHAVCTNPLTCPAGQAVGTPVPSAESWHYSIGHWVEDDPVVGDGAFSSAGAFGFYPWIDSGKTYYGVVARQVFAQNAGYDSARCGRLIRKAWVTGTVQ